MILYYVNIMIAMFVNLSKLCSAALKFIQSYSSIYAPTFECTAGSYFYCYVTIDTCHILLKCIYYRAFLTAHFVSCL